MAYDKKIIGDLAVTGNITDDNGHALPVAEIENNTNKVTSLSSSSTDAQYPSARATWDQLQDIRGVAEGKCQTFVLSDKVLRIENHGNIIIDGQEDPAHPDCFYVWDSTENKWEEKHGELDAGTYDNLTIVNNIFNSTENFISPSGQGAAKYLLISSAYTSYAYLICVTFSFESISAYPLHTGDIFLVTETNVPDRWYTNSGFYELWKLYICSSK